jgi:hypothetical protein
MNDEQWKIPLLPAKEDECWLMVQVLREKVKEQQAEIEALNHQVTIWENATMQARIQSGLYQAEIVKLKLEWQYMATKLEEYSLLYGAK